MPTLHAHPRTEPPNDERPGARPLSLAVLSVGTFALGVDGFVLAGLLPQVSGDLHVSVSTAGQLTTLFALVYAVGSPIIGAATGSWERRTVLRAGMAVFVVGGALQAAGPTFAVVAAGRVIAAVGAAAYQANAYSTAALLSDDRTRARSLAVVAGGSSVALVAGLPFGILIGQAEGWRTAMWLIVGLAIVSGVAVGGLPALHAPRTGLGDRVRVLRDRRILALLVTTLTVMTPSFLIIGYLPPMLGASGALVVVGTVALGGGQVIGTALVARVVDRWGPRAALVVGAGLIVAATSALIPLRTTPAGALVCLAVLGVGTGSVIVPQQHRLFGLVPEQAPVAMGLNGSALYLASALGAAVGGADLAAAGAGGMAPAALVIGALAVTLAATVRPEASRQPETSR